LKLFGKRLSELLASNQTAPAVRLKASAIDTIKLIKVEGHPLFISVFLAVAARPVSMARMVMIDGEVPERY
jgi:hypothetical protein